MAKLSDEQITQIVNQLDDIGRSDLADYFIESNDKLSYLRNEIAPILEEQDTKYTDKYSSIDEFIGDRNSRLSKLYKDLDGKKPGKARMYSFLDNNPDISEQDVNEWFDKTNAYKEDYIKERKYEADRIKRAKEVENLDWWKDLATSDYSKQRYIDDPSTSILGGKEFNPYSKEGQSELRDLFLGFTGAAADVIPTPWQTHVWLGPAIRTARDVYHGESDELYKPEGTRFIDYAKRAAGDVGANAVYEYTPNFLLRKLSKVESGAAKELNKYIAQPYMDMKLNKETKSIKDSYKQVDELLNSNITPLEMYNEIKSLPNTEYKQSLLSNINLQRGSIPSQIQQQQRIWEKQLDPKAQEAFAALRNQGTNIKSVGAYTKEPSDYFLRSATRPKLNKVQSVESKLMGISGPGVVGGLKVASIPEINVTNEDRTRIDWYKDNYNRDWALGFEPEYKEGDPKWIAFEELYPEKAALIRMKAQYKGVK